MNLGQGTVLLVVLGVLVVPAASWTSAIANLRLFQCPPLFNCFLQCELKKSPVNGCELCECADDSCQGTTCPPGQSCSRMSPYVRSLNLPACIPDLMLRLLPTIAAGVSTTTTTTTTTAPPSQRDQARIFKCPADFINGTSNFCQPACGFGNSCMKLTQLQIPVCCAGTNLVPVRSQEPKIDPASDRCRTPMEVGPCRAAHERFGFNSNTGKCELFHFGGCSPNSNNFESLTECKLTCEPQARDTQEPNPCDEPPSPGFCRAMFKRFSYDKASNACVEFVYGGCGSNGNNFDTKGDCERRCIRV